MTEPQTDPLGGMIGPPSVLGAGAVPSLTGNPASLQPPARQPAPIAAPAAVPASPGFDMSGFVDRNMQLEGTGPDPRSSAVSGFMPDTWIGQVRKNVPTAAGMSDEQVLAMRADPAMRRQMWASLARDNAAALEGAGSPVNATTLRLANWFGAEGANKLLGAADDAPIGSVFDRKVIKANPTLAGKTVGQVKETVAQQIGMPGMLSLGDLTAQANKVRESYAKSAGNLDASAAAAIKQITDGGGKIDEAMKRVRAAQDKSYEANEASLKAISNAPKQPDIDGVQHLNGLATFVGIIGGLFTRQPMRASLNAAASAIEAYNDHDREKYQVAYKNWQCLALDTPLPTPRGWTTIGDVSAGDSLFDESGWPCVVTGVSDIKDGRDCYRITFDDRHSLIADENHLWRTSEGEIRKTNELVAGQDAIDVTAPLQLPWADLPIDPYILGVWLGDGSSAGATIYGHVNDIREMQDHLEKAGAEIGRVCLSKADTNVFRIGVLNLFVVLREMDLLGNKHIPRAYLRASYSQRLALLQGLMDTDGHIPPVNTQCSFYTTSEALAAGFTELIRSLGFKAKYLTRTPHYTYDGEKRVGKLRYHFSFTAYADTPVFRLRRKLAVLEARASRKQVRQRSRRHKIVAVEPAASVPVKCLEVNSQSHLFLAGASMVPTHNTQTDMLFKIAQMSQTRVRDILYDEQMGLNERKALLDTTLRAAGLSQLADTARTQGETVVLDWMEKMNTAQIAHDDKRAQIDATNAYRMALLGQPKNKAQFIQQQIDAMDAEVYGATGEHIPPEEKLKLAAKYGSANAGTGLSDEAADLIASQIVAGQTNATVGLARSPQDMEKVRNAVAKQTNAEVEKLGLPKEKKGELLAIRAAEFQGLQAGERTAAQQEARIGMANHEAQIMMPIAIETSRKVDRTQYPTMNAVLIAAERGTGDENVIKFSTATNSLLQAYARAVTPVGTPTDATRARAAEILNTAFSKGQFEAAISVMQREMTAALQAPGMVKGDLRTTFTGGAGPAPAAPPTAAAPQPAATTPPTGEVIQNGWRYRNDGGQMVPIGPVQ